MNSSYSRRDPDPQQEEQIHTGIVITDHLPNENQIVHYVLELTDYQGKNYDIIWGIHSVAFMVPDNYKPRNANGVDGVDDVVLLAAMKNHRRRVETPLIFGAQISWSSRNVRNTRDILEFNRENQYYPTRCIEGFEQVKILGCISPNQPLKIWTQWFPSMPISLEKSEMLLPNVIVETWINLSVKTYNGQPKLFYEFHSFGEVVDEKQHYLSSVPWNLEVNKYRTIPAPVLYDDHELTMEQDFLVGVNGGADASGKPENIRDKLAYSTGGRSFYCESLSKYEMSLALETENNKPIVGVAYKVCGFYDRFEDRYLLSSARINKETLRRRHDETYLVEPVKEELPGLFKSHYGYMDDPDGFLRLYHLSKYKESTVLVSMRDCHPTHDGQLRFRIAAVQGDKVQKLKTWIQTTKIEVTNSAGIVIDEHATKVISPDHPNIVFECQASVCRQGALPVMGTKIKFSALYNSTDDKFLITEWRDQQQPIVPHVQRQMIRVARSLPQAQSLFQVDVTMRNTYPKMLQSDIFGLIDDMGLIKSHQTGIRHKVWVLLSQPDVTQTIRPAKTMMQVVHVGEAAPDHKIPIDEVLRDLSTPSSSSNAKADKLRTSGPAAGPSQRFGVGKSALSSRSQATAASASFQDNKAATSSYRDPYHESNYARPNPTKTLSPPPRAFDDKAAASSYRDPYHESNYARPNPNRASSPPRPPAPVVVPNESPPSQRAASSAHRETPPPPSSRPVSATPRERLSPLFNSDLDLDAASQQIIVNVNANPPFLEDTVTEEDCIRLLDILRIWHRKKHSVEQTTCGEECRERKAVVKVFIVINEFRPRIMPVWYNNETRSADDFLSILLPRS